MGHHHPRGNFLFRERGLRSSALYHSLRESLTYRSCIVNGLQEHVFIHLKSDTLVFMNFTTERFFRDICVQRNILVKIGSCKMDLLHWEICWQPGCGTPLNISNQRQRTNRKNCDFFHTGNDLTSRFPMCWCQWPCPCPPSATGNTISSNAKSGMKKLSL
jgi:hypothetical protein